MAAPTNTALVKKALANSEPSSGHEFDAERDELTGVADAPVRGSASNSAFQLTAQPDTAAEAFFHKRVTYVGFHLTPGLFRSEVEADYFFHVFV